MAAKTLQSGVNGNQYLRRSGIKIPWTQHQIDEFKKCADDPVYFAKTYVKIQTIDHGIIPFPIRKFQEDILWSILKNRKTIAACCRQSGKTTSVAVAVVHFILFNEAKDVGILANKGDTSKEILRRIQDIYELLPKWMQHGVVEFNKESMELENKCRVFAATTTSDSVRGKSLSLCIIDEAAFIPNFSAWLRSTYPTISSGKTSKLVMISTPNGFNHFKTFWDGANAKGDDWNGFHAFMVTWRDIPERNNPEWEKAERAVLGDEGFDTEHNVAFYGSAKTLISPMVLKSLKASPAKFSPVNPGLKMYCDSIPKSHQYMLIADVSQGKGLDYSAFSVIDLSCTPYQQVCAFRDNKVEPIAYGELIFRVAKRFNDALVLIELNNMGMQTARVIKYDLEYENIIHSVSLGRKGQIPCLWHAKGEPGVTTSKTTKAIGCNMFKHLVEQGHLKINDQQTINEATTFVRNDVATESYSAQEGSYDDTIMPLVLFGWITNSQFFSDLTDSEMRKKLRMENAEAIEESSNSMFMVSTYDDSLPIHRLSAADKDVWFMADDGGFREHQNDFYISSHLPIPNVPGRYDPMNIDQLLNIGDGDVHRTR